MAQGTKCVVDLLTETSYVPVCIVATAKWWEEHGELSAIYLPVALQATTADMERMSSLTTAPQVLAVFNKPDFELPCLDPQKLYLALDDVQDPGNMGTIIRLADWFGVTDIFASLNTVDVFNPKCLMATMGSIGRVRVHYVDLPDFLHSAAHDGLPVWGTFLDGENIYDIPDNTRRNGILVMGNEGKGISARVAQCATHRILIPPYPVDRRGAESLNVAMATAVVLADFRRPK